MNLVYSSDTTQLLFAQFSIFAASTHVYCADLAAFSQLELIETRLFSTTTCIECEKVQSYSDVLCSLRCQPLIKYPTRISTNTSTLIDHLYTNNSTYKINTNILIDDISDHLPILFSLENVKHKNKEINTLIRGTKKFNAEDFLIDLMEELECFSSNRCQSTDEQLDCFVKTFERTLRKHAPLQKKTKKK